MRRQARRTPLFGITLVADEDSRRKYASRRESVADVCSNYGLLVRTHNRYAYRAPGHVNLVRACIVEHRIYAYAHPGAGIGYTTTDGRRMLANAASEDQRVNSAQRAGE